jgi:hypothetical protein
MQVGLLSERGTGPYPGDYRRAFAFCKILYPPVYGAGCPDPSPRGEGPPRRPTPPSRALAPGGNRRAYPVQDATRDVLQRPVPLGSYSTPGEWMPEWHGQ